MGPSITDRARSEGTAKPIPWLPPERLRMAVLMPITSPREFSSGPPELPGLTDASVWMASSIRLPEGICTERMAEMMPRVMVPERPKGLPMA